MATGFFSWSQTAASNATADASVNWAEGQAPSSVNDSSRAMMAALAKYRDDNSGFLVTGGTSTAYTLTTNQSFSSTTELNGQEISFTITPASGATPTLNVNGIGAFPLVNAAGSPIATGSLRDGGIYTATFVNSLSCWKVRSIFAADLFAVPVGGTLIYFGTTVPNSNFAFANGAAISRATYATLFGIIGTTYGAGDGSTTFNLPDLSGRVPAGREASASRLTATYFGGNSTVLGATGGSESQALTTAQLAVTTPAGTISAITPAGTISAITPAGTISTITPSGSVSGAASGSDTILVNGNTAQNLQGGTTGFGWSNSPTLKAIAAALGWSGSFTGVPVTPTFTGSAATPTFTGSAATPTFTGSAFGSGSAHNNVQPTIICNYLIRII